MIFPERIKNIKPSFKVLEIGPGGSPYPRSDVFLEKIFNDSNEFKSQRGHQPELKTDKPVFFYTGEKFPFKDKEFDYIICSHVLEHVENVDSFLSELVRVGKMGYLEYPTIYYDHLYNFKEHISIPFYKNGIIYWARKAETCLNNLQSVQDLFYEAQWKHYNQINIDLAQFFFQGFEWSDSISSMHVTDLSYLTFSKDEIQQSLHPKPVQSDNIGIKNAVNLLVKAVSHKIGLK